MSGEADNLDARMEAIRLKNEELEKKHREIKEDEIMAKKENATVDLKNVSPVTPHPYDNIELDFDVKEGEKELAKKSDFKPKNRRPILKQELLDEIPPDPVNFLREDGNEQERTPRPPPNRNNQRNNNRNRRPPQSNKEGSSGGDITPSGDSPTHGPGNYQNQRPKQPPRDGGSSSPKKPTHPQQLRSERRSVPQDFEAQQMGGQPPHPQQNRQRRPQNNRPPPNRDNATGSKITVEVKDGEVRSVKLKPEKTYGTGRVRPENIDKFTVDTFDPNNVDGGDRRQHSKADERSPQDRNRNRNPRNNRKPQQQKPGQREFQHPTLENLVVPKANVQDRLMRIAKDAPEEIPTAADGN